MKHKHVKQHDATDCAAACLTMICLYYKKETTITRLRDMMGTDLKGTNNQCAGKGKRILFALFFNSSSPFSSLYSRGRKFPAFKMAYEFADGSFPKRDLHLSILPHIDLYNISTVGAKGPPWESKRIFAIDVTLSMQT